MKKTINETFFLRPWAITEDVLGVMTEIVMRHLKGEKLSSDEISAKVGDKKKPDTSAYEIVNGAALIPVYGVISKRMNLFNDISGGTSIEMLRRNFSAALADPNVKRIVFDIDSPGGSSDGVTEMAEAIYSARGTKPMIAYANGMMASAAYWLGCAADEVYASKDASVGSIGVYAVLRDWSVYEHNMGVKTAIIKAGKFKAAGHSSKPMTEEDKAVIQEEVDDVFGLFTDAVGRNRDLTAEGISKVATGRCFIADKAAKLGLIDGVATLESILGVSPSSSGSKPPVPARAESAGDKIQTKTETKQEDRMELTVEQVKKEHPAVADALRSEGKEAAFTEGKAAGIAEGKKAGEEAVRTEERARVTGIIEAAPKGMEAVALECLKAGVSVVDAKDRFLKKLQEAAPASPGTPQESEKKSEETKTLSFEEQCKKDWETKTELHQDFASLETYTGYQRAVSKGRVHARRK